MLYHIEITTKRKQVNVSTFIDMKPVNETENSSIWNPFTSSENEPKTDSNIVNCIIEL